MIRILTWATLAYAAAGAGHAWAQATGEAAATLIRESAVALGGLERIESIRRIQLYGYGQEADGFGHSNISASPHAPQKWGAQNYLQRVWDLENERYLEQQRGNLLFPFAAPFGHDFALDRRALDRDVSFSIAEDGEMQRSDDVRDLRMWMHANPVVAIRAALADDSRLTNVRVEQGRALVDVTLATGETFTIASDWVTKLPQFVRWSGPNRNLGEVVYTVWFTGYQPYDGVELPLGLVIYIDWRDVEFFKMYVNGYVIDGEISDLAAPRAVRTAVLEDSAPNPQAERVADGIWRITGGTSVIEFADHLTLFELGGFGTDADTLAVIDLARTLVPGKPVTELIVSHAHDDHSSGLRTAIAEGLTIIARRGNEVLFREVAARPAPNFPDMLHRNPQPLKFVPVDAHLRLEDSARILDVYHVIGNNHMADAVFAFAPGPNVLIEADVATAASEWQWWADSYLDNVDHYDLDVEIVSPVHAYVMTHEEVLEFIAPGRVRVQERCRDYAARGDYLAGCPAFLPRGSLLE